MTYLFFLEECCESASEFSEYIFGSDISWGILNRMRHSECQAKGYAEKQGGTHQQGHLPGQRDITQGGLQESCYYDQHALTEDGREAVESASDSDEE